MLVLLLLPGVTALFPVAARNESRRSAAAFSASNSTWNLHKYWHQFSVCTYACLLITFFSASLPVAVLASRKHLITAVEKSRNVWKIQYARTHSLQMQLPSDVRCLLLSSLFRNTADDRAWICFSWLRQHMEHVCRSKRTSERCFAKANYTRLFGQLNEPLR